MNISLCVLVLSCATGNMLFCSPDVARSIRLQQSVVLALHLRLSGDLGLGVGNLNTQLLRARNDLDPLP